MEPSHISSLAEFKRFFAQPGATVQLIRHDYIDPVARPDCFQPRKVKRLQTNAVQFTPTAEGKDGSWLQFGKASQYRFNVTKPDEVIVSLMDEQGRFDKVMIYKCWVE